MPGVSVTTAVRPGPSAPLTAPSGQFFVVGMAERGPANVPTRVRGMADFRVIFGDRVAYSELYDNVSTFFEEGGAQAWIMRVVGPAATTGSVTADDRQYIPEPTVTFTASGPGAWSSNLSVVVTDLPNTTKFEVLLNGERVERFFAASLDEMLSVFSTSRYVVATSEGSTADAPDNMPAEDTYVLSAGSDDRGSVTTSSYTTALNLFEYELGDGAVAIPGLGSAVHLAIIDHCKTNKRIGLLSMASDTSIASLKSQADNLDSEYAGLFAPWVQVPTATGARFTSPEGYVAAARARAHTDTGAWRVPAGEIAVARSLVGLSDDFNRIEGDDLDESKVNAIRVINNTIRLYGWRSLSNDTRNFALLNIRDLLNYLVFTAESTLQPYVFRTVDARGQLLSQVNGVLTGILEPIRVAGGLFEKFAENGDQLDPGYLVDTGSSVNTLENLANNEIRAKVSVRPSPSAALISVTIVKVGLLDNL